MKNEYLQVRVNEEEKAEISEIATEKDIPVSQFIREAVREKIAAHKESQRAERAESIAALN